MAGQIRVEPRGVVGGAGWLSLLMLLNTLASGQAAAPLAESGPSSYRGWKSICLSNDLIRLQVVPEIGGRIIQFALGATEFLWVNPVLAGRMPPPTGLAPDGGWLNYGGDKLWPAPQGWDSPEQWPGPPDAVLDGQPYTLKHLRRKGEVVAIQLTSAKDLRTGLQFSRVVRLYSGSTRVGFEATMKNIDSQPRRWGLWAHTQLNAARADGSGPNVSLQAWCPLNPESKFPKGYTRMFGAMDHPSFQRDSKRGLMRVRYQYQVGKIGLDSPAGWVATVNGESGTVFVQRFVFEPQAQYPDGSSVEFWLNGLGQIHAYNRDVVMSTNLAENPYVLESEILSPFARLEPGHAFTWRYDWYACNLGGDFPVVDCTPAGVASEPRSARFAEGRLNLQARLGVFAPGAVVGEALDAVGQRLARVPLEPAASPLRAVQVETSIALSERPASVRLLLEPASPLAQGGEITRVPVR